MRLHKSIDYPYDKFVVINNSKEKDVFSAIEEIRKIIPDKLFVRNSSKNTGVAGGWNSIIKDFPSPWTMICGNDVLFSPGDLEKLASATWKDYETHGKFFANQGHNAYTITRLAIDQVGYFDENFYPAYLEDCDYQRRMDLAKCPCMNVQECHVVHGEPPPNVPKEDPNWGSATIHSNRRYSIANGITHGNGHEYYRKKWGNPHGHETYIHPFNDPKQNIKDWTLDLELRERNDIWGV